MLFRKLLLLMSAVVFSVGVFSLDAKILIPEDFDIQVVNGKEYSAPLFQKKSVQVVVLDATRDRQQIVVRYSQVFDDGDDFDVVKSKPFMFEFKVGATTQLKLEFQAPSDYAEARVFAKNPVVSVVSDDKKVPVVHSYDVEQKAWLASFVTPQEQSTALAEDVVVSKPASELKKVSPVSQLFYWWDQASEAERETFLRHVSD